MGNRSPFRAGSKADKLGVREQIEAVLTYPRYGLSRRPCILYADDPISRYRSHSLWVTRSALLPDDRGTRRLDLDHGIDHRYLEEK